MNFLIRPAVVENAAEIARVRVTTWQATYRGLINQSYLDQMNVEAETERWREGLVSMPSERVIFIAKVQSDGEQPGGEGEMVGYIAAGPVRDPDPQYQTEIYALYVLPGYQGCGIGRSLLITAAGWLIEKGYQTLIIYVLDQNLPARKFYEAMGGSLVRELTRQDLGLILTEVGYGYNLAEMKATF